MDETPATGFDLKSALQRHRGAVALLDRIDVMDSSFARLFANVEEVERDIASEFRRLSDALSVARVDSKRLDKLDVCITRLSASGDEEAPWKIQTGFTMSGAVYQWAKSVRAAIDLLPEVPHD